MKVKCVKCLGIESCFTPGYFSNTYSIMRRIAESNENKYL